MRNVFRLVGLALVAAAATSCGDVVREGSSPVYLVIDTLAASRGGSSSAVASSNLLSDVITNAISPPPCTTSAPCPTVFDDTGTVTLRAPLKDIGGATPLVPTSNNEVTITRYTVEYVRTDGRNAPGVDVPYPIDGAVTGTIQAGGTLSVGFEIVRHNAKQEAPLAELRTSPNIIVTNAKVTFYGRDRVGNSVTVSGQIQINFGNFGDI
ncbi:MAG: hypothetical protein JF610_11665 [Acidobacteria bacterium]|nr:hypothetical protein [Acidobacteriota bacterium]